MIYLTIEDILMLAERHLCNYQILNEGQLLHAVSSVQQEIYGTELYPTLPKKAAVYLRNIIQGHIFLDGNKRVGKHAALLFLRLNNCKLKRNIDDSIIELCLNIAKGSTTDIEVIAEQIQSWIVTNER